MSDETTKKARAVAFASNGAARNLAKLPECCFSVLNTTNEIIFIERGEDGYKAADQNWTIGKAMMFDEALNVPAGSVKQADEREYMDRVADVLNREIYSVTRPQREAMEAGSMFGWHVPAADPDRYNEDGTFKK